MKFAPVRIECCQAQNCWTATSTGSPQIWQEENPFAGWRIRPIQRKVSTKLPSYFTKYKKYLALSCPERILGFSAARRVTYDVCDILFGLITRFKHICGCFIVKKHLYMLSTEIISFSTTCTSNKNPHQSETVCPELSDIYNFQDFYQLHFFRFSPWPKTPLKSVNSCQASRSWLTQRYRQNTLVRGTHQSVSRPLRPKREMELVSVALKFMKLF